MIQPYLILASGLAITGVLQRRKKLNLKVKQVQRQFEREQQKMNDTSRAENLLRARISLEEKSHKIQESIVQINILMRKAETQFAREEWAKAEKNLVQVLSFDEHNLKANRLLGLTYLHRGEWKKAELIYKNLFDLEPREASHYGNLGLAFYHQAKYPFAREAYKNALRIDDKKASRWVSLGQVYLKLKDFTSAQDAFAHAVKLEGRNLEYLFALAEACELGANIKYARKTYERILELSPYSEEAKEKLAKLEEKL